MDSNTLRGEIMRLVGEHEATGSSAYMEDKALANAIGVPLVDVQRQIRILESNGLLDVAATFGSTYAVRLTPQAGRVLAFGSRHPLTKRIRNATTTFTFTGCDSVVDRNGRPAECRSLAQMPVDRGRSAFLRVRAVQQRLMPKQ